MIDPSLVDGTVPIANLFIEDFMQMVRLVNENQLLINQLSL